MRRIAGEEEEEVLMGVNWPVVAASAAGFAIDMFELSWKSRECSSRVSIHVHFQETAYDTFIEEAAFRCSNAPNLVSSHDGGV